MVARYPLARWMGPVPNEGGPLIKTDVRFIVVHIMQGNSLDGCSAWFHNPSSQVSAHFGIGRDGEVYQWVDIDRVAWAEADYNGVGISIEHAGYSGEGLTAKQLAASMRLQSWIRAQFLGQIPARMTANAAGRGVIGHGSLGVAGGDHPHCPGSPVLEQFQAAYDSLARKKVEMTAPASPLTLRDVKNKVVAVSDGVKVPAAWTIIINDFVKVFHLAPNVGQALTYAAAFVLGLELHAKTAKK